MVKKNVLFVRISEDQMRILQTKSRAFGFTKISDYVRFTLFMSMPIEEKINKIYDKVVKDG